MAWPTLMKLQRRLVIWKLLGELCRHCSSGEVHRRNENLSRCLEEVQADISRISDRMQVPTALVVVLLLLPVNEQVARKAARRERQRGRAATSAAASRMFTDQSQRCLAQGAAFCRKCTFQVHDRFCNFARYKDTDSDSGQTNIAFVRTSTWKTKIRLHTPAAQSYSHASRPLYVQALVLHRTAAHIRMLPYV